MFKDCIFDFYGTLVDIRTDEDKEELWLAMAEEFAPHGMIADPVLLRDTYRSLVEKEERDLLVRYPDGDGEIQVDRVFAGLFSPPLATWNSPVIKEAGKRFRELSRAYIRPYPYVKEMLMSLRAAGRRVWLLSNAQRLFTEEELKMTGLLDCFDGIYLSSDYGVKKPHEDFFRILLEEREICPQEAIMTGNDGRCDMAGAKAVQLATLYLHSETSPKEDLPEADFLLDEPDMKAVQRILLS